MLKLKMMLCVMMLPLVVVGCTSKQSVSQCVKPPPPPAWDNAASPDWQTPLNGIIISPQREADHYAKTTEGTRSINEQCRGCPYRWATHAIIVSNTQCASSGV